MKNTRLPFYILLAILVLSICFYRCENNTINEINIGYISSTDIETNAFDKVSVNAVQLAIDQYNASRLNSQPKINLFIEFKQRNTSTKSVYKNLKKTRDIDILFIGDTNGTVAIKDDVLKDKVIVINPLNNNELLRTLNENIFTIAKSTEEANGLIGLRLIELKYKKVAIFNHPNDLMSTATNEVKRLLDKENISYKVIKTKIGTTNYTNELKELKANNYEAYVFFGYNEYGHAMKQARDMGITARFFSSTALLDPKYYSNSKGSIINTEFPFFTVSDGNHILANEFLKNYKQKFNNEPNSIWAAMQAYDATNIVITELKNINQNKTISVHLDQWLKNSLKNVKYFEGVCGNIAITNEGASKGIYFSLYYFADKLNPIVQVKS